MKGFDPIKSWDADDAAKYATYLRGEEADAATLIQETLFRLVWLHLAGYRRRPKIEHGCHG